MSIRYLTVAAILGLAAGALAETRWGQVELAFFRVRGENGRMVDLPTKGIVLPVRMERIDARPIGRSGGTIDLSGGDLFPTAHTIYQNDLGTNYFYPDSPSCLDDINALPSGNNEWWHELTLGMNSTIGNPSVKVMNRQLGWTTYSQGRGPGVQAFDNMVTDVGWVFQPGQFPPGAWKYTIPVYQYWSMIPDWNKPRVPNGLLYFAQEWRAYDLFGNGAFLMDFAPVFSGDGEPQVGSSLDNFWFDFDPVPDGVFSEDEFDYFGGPPNQANFLMTVTSQSTGVIDTVRPTSVTLSRGIYVGGNVGSFHFVDQNTYRANKGLVINQAEAPIQIVLEGFSPSANLTALSLDMMTMVTTSGLQQKLELFNYQTSQWVQVDVRAAPTTDTRITVGAPGTATEYIDVPNGNVVKMRVSYKQVAPTSTLNWGCRIDLGTWLATHP